MTKHCVDSVRFRGRRIFLAVDGREYSFNLNTISLRLANAGKKERETFEISPSGYGIHWPLLDEDLSIAALIGLSQRDDAPAPRH
jgi:hypothetical protein